MAFFVPVVKIYAQAHGVALELAVLTRFHARFIFPVLVRGYVKLSESSNKNPEKLRSYPPMGYPQNLLIQRCGVTSLEQRRQCHYVVFLYKALHAAINCSAILEPPNFHTSVVVFCLIVVL